MVVVGTHNFLRGQSFKSILVLFCLARLGPEVLRATKARSSLPLNVQLGPWIGARHLSQRKWDSYVSFDSHILYHRRIVGYRLHNPLAGTFRHRRFQNDYFSALPDMSSVTNFVPVSVSATNHSLDSSKLPPPASCLRRYPQDACFQHRLL
jgi:hypothetical protein